MIKLRGITGSMARSLLLMNETSEDKANKIMKKVNGRKITWGTDKSEIFTVVKVGNNYGVSKRCTYARMVDKPKFCLGFTLALVRALNGKLGGRA